MALHCRSSRFKVCLDMVTKESMDNLRLSYSKRLAHETVSKRKSLAVFSKPSNVPPLSKILLTTARYRQLRESALFPPLLILPASMSLRISSLITWLSQYAHKGAVGCRRTNCVCGRRHTVTAFAHALYVARPRSVGHVDAQVI